MTRQEEYYTTILSFYTSARDFIDKDECLELVIYANRLSGYLRGFMNE